MVNDSERILSTFSKLYFFKELVHDNLHFTLDKDSEHEVADILLNLGDIIIAIQLKSRNNDYSTTNEQTEIKWLGKNCKVAKRQVQDSIHFIQSGKLPSFKNGNNHDIHLRADAKIIPLVIFMNKRIKTYNHILKKHSDEGMDINCMSFEDFQKMCEILITPIEIAEYLEWRLNFYKINYFTVSSDISGFQNNEASVYQFLAESYGIKEAQALRNYMQFFREILHQIPKHTIMQSEELAGEETTLFFAHFNRPEIKYFIDEFTKCLNSAHHIIEGCSITGNMRVFLQKYLIFFTSSKSGLYPSSEQILSLVPNRDEIDKLLQIVIFFESETVYRVDFHHIKP